MTEWGYKRGFMKTPIYDEVHDVLTEWKALNIKIYVSLASVSFVNMVSKLF